jgi:hypothetical protein
VQPENPNLKTWTTRLPEETIKKLEKLANYEGKPIQEVADRILNLFFENLGQIPEKKSLIASWPERKKRA